MKRFLLVLALIVILCDSFGQGAEKQKLLDQALEKASDLKQSDSTRFMSYIGLVQEYMQLKEDTYYQAFLDSAESIASRSENTFYGGMLVYTKAMREFYYGSSTENAIALLKKSELLFGKSNMGKKYLPFVYSLLSLCYERKKETELAIEQIKKTIVYYDSIDDKRRKSIAYLNLGYIEAGRDNYEEAIRNYNESFILKKQTGDSLGMIKIWQNSAEIFNSYLDNKEKAIDYLEKSIEVSELIGDTLSYAIGSISLLAIQDSLDADTEIPTILNYLNTFQKFNYSEMEGLTLSIMAGYYLKTGKLDSAFTFISRSLEIAENSSYEGNRISAMTRLGEVLMEQEEYAKATYLLLEAAQKANRTGETKSEYWAYKTLSKVGMRTGNYKKALNYYMKYDSLNDELYKLEKVNAVEEIQVKYETAEKDKQIILERAEKEKERIKNNGLTGLIAMTLFLLAIIFLQNQKVKKQRDKAQEDTVLISSQKKDIERLKKNFEHQINNELEKYKELHLPEDAFVRKEEYDNYINKFRQVTALVQYNKTVSEYNNHNLALNELFQSELSFFKHLSEQVGRSVSCTMVFKGDENSVAEYSENAVPLMRDIISELLRNADKHAFEGIKSPEISIMVNIELEKQSVSIEYHDNGNGIPDGKSPKVISDTVQRLNGSLKYGNDERGAYVKIENLNVMKNEPS